VTDNAIYRADGNQLVPSELAQGPWDRTTCHGGPVSGALARAIESIETPIPARVARLTIDLLRPVPLQPVEIRTEVVRQGSKIAVCDASMWWNDKLVARASALLIRDDGDVANDPRMNEIAAGATPEGRSAEPVSEFEQIRASGAAATVDFELPGFVRALELHRVVGGRQEGTPAVGWAKLTSPLVEGERTTPLQRVACLGDFTSGLANYIDYFNYTSPNADLTFHLVRYPVDEWICLDCSTVIGEDGIAQSRARLFDVDGYFGHSAASIVVSPR
jgi:hypothetical protein